MTWRALHPVTRSVTLLSGAAVILLNVVVCLWSHPGTTYLGWPKPALLMIRATRRIWGNATDIAVTFALDGACAILLLALVAAVCEWVIRRPRIRWHLSSQLLAVLVAAVVLYGNLVPECLTIVVPNPGQVTECWQLSYWGWPVRGANMHTQEYPRPTPTAGPDPIQWYWTGALADLLVGVSVVFACAFLWEMRQRRRAVKST